MKKVHPEVDLSMTQPGRSAGLVTRYQAAACSS